MKVCHVTSAHERYDTRIFHKECSSLAKAGYDVTLLVADNLPAETKNGVKIVSVDFHPKDRIDRILHSVGKMFGKALEINADIYHLHDPELLPLGKKLKQHGKKVIFDSHEDVAGQILGKTWIPKLLRKPISKLYTFYGTPLMAKFDALIGVTPTLVDKLRIVNSNTIMLTNYPILDDNNYLTGKKYDTPTLVFAGGISEQWNHETILQAIENIDVKYMLMGFGESSYLDKLKSYPAWCKVEFLGRVPHETVSGKMQRCFAGLSLLSPSNNTERA